MSVWIEDIEFDRVSYDAGNDVLYLSVKGTEPADWDESPEGHALRFDANGRLMGITLVGVRQTLEAEGDVRLTLPHEVHLRGELADALAS